MEHTFSMVLSVPGMCKETCQWLVCLICGSPVRMWELSSFTVSMHHIMEKRDYMFFLQLAYQEKA